MSSTQGPRASVIIPAYFSMSTIAACLDALREQSFRDFEVIVVNSSPESETERIVRAHYSEARFTQSRARLLPHAARNLGAQQAAGELLVFTDPDCRPETAWLKSLVTAYESGHGVIVGGMGLGSRSWWETGVHLCKFHWLLPTLKPGTKPCAATANAAYSRKLWESIGPFPGHVFCGDGILTRRAALRGQPPRFVPEAVVQHRHLDSFSGFCRQRFGRGREYATAQIELMGPPTLFTWLRLTFSWVAIGWVLCRAGADAIRAGWGKAFVSTLPIQFVGHGMWEIGESAGTVRLLAQRLTKNVGAR